MTCVWSTVLFVYVYSWHQASTALRALSGATTQTASSSRSMPEMRPLHWARWRGHSSPLKVFDAFTHILHSLCCGAIMVSWLETKIGCSKLWLNNIFVCTSLSVLRKLTVHGFQEPQQNIEVMVSLHSALTAKESAAFLLMLSRKQVLSQCAKYERPWRLKLPRASFSWGICFPQPLVQWKSSFLKLLI